MTDTLDSIHQAFAEYRRHQRLGPYPRVLRERALRTLSESELTELGARLELTPAQVRRWCEIFGANKASRASKKPRASKAPTKPLVTDAPDFYEVPVSVIAPAAHQVAPIEVAIEWAGGSKMHIKGVGHDLVRALFADLQAAARAS
jgi:hypothetical protein